ncbi:MAG: hypothetical protein R8K20_07190 [Gallionellaceae bacterium]
MRKLFVLFILIMSFGIAIPAFADQNDFCAGFVEGYKAVKGDMVLVPLCPLAPLTPLGSNDYREGLKAGMRAAGR